VRSASPLRYPGGKSRLAAFASEFIRRNFRTAPLYIEPYAGGAGLALSLLFGKKVSGIWLNDLDPAIYACWCSMLNESSRFCDALRNTPLTLKEWRRQKSIYRAGYVGDAFAFGFSTFFLNRTNHSGILNGGLIGGRNQSGMWKLDARFNRSDLIRRVQRLGQYRRQIKLTCVDGAQMIRRLRPASNCLVYIDPPYVSAGKALYMNAYTGLAHVSVRDAIERLQRKWIVSYDDVPLVRSLYKKYRVRRIELLHTAREARVGREVLFFSKGSVIPKLPGIRDES
jgi:DNA adenine methylase